MKTVLPKLFKWRPSRETLAALAAGVVVLCLSAAMVLLEKWPWMNIAVRDIGQIFLAGILFPLLYIQRSGEDWAEFGFSLRKWPLHLLINLVLGVILFFPFFLGIGGTYDVLIQSKVVSPILHPEARTLYLSVAISASAFWFWKRRGSASV